MSVEAITSEIMSLLNVAEERCGCALEQSEIDAIVSEALSGLGTPTLNWETLNYSPDQPRDKSGRFTRKDVASLPEKKQGLFKRVLSKFGIGKDTPAPRASQSPSVERASAPIDKVSELKERVRKQKAVADAVHRHFESMHREIEHDRAMGKKITKKRTQAFIRLGKKYEKEAAKWDHLSEDLYKTGSTLNMEDEQSLSAVSIHEQGSMVDLVTVLEDELGRELTPSEVDSAVGDYIADDYNTPLTNIGIWYTLNFDPNQPRDSSGKWAKVGSSTPASAIQSKAVETPSSISRLQGKSALADTAKDIGRFVSVHAKDIVKGTYDAITHVVKSVAPHVLDAAKATAKVGGRVLGKGLQFIRDRYGNKESLLTFAAAAGLFGLISVATAGGAAIAAAPHAFHTIVPGVMGITQAIGFSAPIAGSAAAAVAGSAFSNPVGMAAFALAATEARNVVSGIAAFSEGKGSATREEGIKRLTRGFTSNASLDAWVNDTLQLIKDLSEALKVQTPPVTFEQIREALKEASAAMPTTNQLRWVTLNASKKKDGDDESEGGEHVFETEDQRKAFFGKLKGGDIKGTKSTKQVGSEKKEDEPKSSFVHPSLEQRKKTETRQDAREKAYADTVSQRAYTTSKIAEGTGGRSSHTRAADAHDKAASKHKESAQVVTTKDQEEYHKAKEKEHDEKAEYHRNKAEGKQTNNVVGGYLSPKVKWVTLNLFDESKHKRDRAGKFTSGGGQSAPSQPGAGGKGQSSNLPPPSQSHAGDSRVVKLAGPLKEVDKFFGGWVGGPLGKSNIEDAKGVAKGLFSRMTLGTGPLIAKGIAAGIRHSPKAFRLLSKALMALAPKKEMKDRGQDPGMQPSSGTTASASNIPPPAQTASGTSSSRKRKHDLAQVRTVRNAAPPSHGRDRVAQSPKPDERSQARAKMYMDQLKQVLESDPDEVIKLIIACKEAMKAMGQPTLNWQSINRG